MSDVVLGLVGKDYTLIACDAAVARSIIVYKDGEDKLLRVSGDKIMGAGGPASDRVHFTEWLSKNLTLNSLRSGLFLSTHATANFARNELAEALRSAPFQVNLLIGGYHAPATSLQTKSSSSSSSSSPASATPVPTLENQSVGPALYFLDYLGALHRVKNGAHGYASYFALSLFDRYYRADMNEQEGVELIQIIINELRLRFLLKIGQIKIKIVNAQGVRDLILPAAINEDAKIAEQLIQAAEKQAQLAAAASTSLSTTPMTVK